MEESLIRAAEVAAVVVLVLLVLARPYLGIVITAASLPVTEILPSIPLLTSIVPVFGYASIGGLLLLRAKEHDRLLLRLNGVLYLSLLFCIWLFVSNPSAAWFGEARNWVLTFAQLWLLASLARALINTPRKHYVLMGIYSIATIFSALIAMQQGQIGESIYVTVRGVGLTEGANSAARYFVVATVFLIYLQGVAKRGLVRTLIILGIVVTVLGTIFTASRTGILLLVVAFGLLTLQQVSPKSRLRVALIFGITLLAIWFFADNIFAVIRTSLPTISQGTDTIGERYSLWKAGWRMWLDHPIAGVGIGLYPRWLAYYGADLLPPRALRLGAHNMYIHVLSETGVVGFMLFVSMLVLALSNFWRCRNIGNLTFSSLADVWFTVLIVVLVGGITKSDQADKLLWLCVGVSGFFSQQVRQAEDSEQHEHQSNAYHRPVGKRWRGTPTGLPGQGPAE